MTPEQRRKLEQIASMILLGECPCDEHPNGYEMAIDDALYTATQAVQTVRTVLDMPSHGPTERERDLAELLSGQHVTANNNDGMLGYARLVLATDTPVERAVAYLSDTATPQSASGRLLLRAAERALRAAGDL
jgi:hypothetical protein